MHAEKIKQIISKSIFLKVVLLIVTVIVLILYFKAFYTTGVYFDGAFLKKEVVFIDNHYIGRNKYGNIHIIIKGLPNKHSNVDVIYKLPNNINKQYTVNFKDARNWELGIKNIEDESGNIIFEGEYRKDSPFLFDKNGEPLLDDSIIRVQINGVSPYNDDYKISLKNIANFATFSNETIRGDYKFLIGAILLFILTLVDIKYPLFFFTLRNFLYVKDAEPSDFYITMQRISWYVYPIIVIILMIVAIC